MFPTPLHANLVFAAFDIHNANALNPVQLEHALHAVGLGDAPKQIVYGIIRQARNETPSSASPTVLSPALTSVSGMPSMLAKGGGNGSFRLPAAVVGGPTASSSSGAPLNTGGAGVAPTPSSLFPQDFHTAPIVSVALEEFLLVVKELAPAVGSSEEVWKGFKCLDVQQRGRISLDTMLHVARRDEDKLVGKLLLNPEAAKQHLLHRPPQSQSGVWTSPPRDAAGSVPRVPPRHGSAVMKHGRSAHQIGQESTLRRLVEQAAEYREKGVSFDEWRLALAS